MLFTKKDYGRPFRLLVAIFFSLLITVPVINHSAYIQFIDISLTGDVQRRESALWHFFYVFISFVGSPKTGLLWILIIAFLLWGFKYKIQSLWAIGLVVGGDLVDEIVKHLVRRARPSFHPAVDTGYSFPSAHVFSTFMIVAVLWFVVIPQIKQRRNRIIAQAACWIAVALVMLARIYLNAHYPTDTLGALAYGYVWLQISEYLYLVIGPYLGRRKLTEHSYL